MESLRKLKPDIVHASLTLSPLDFRLPEICQELDMPLMATFHTPFGGKSFNLKAQTQFIPYQLYAPFLANYDRVVVFSYRQREILIKLGVAPENLVVIPNGVDSEKYCPGRSIYKPRFQAKRLFVYLGRIATEKNVEALLKGWKYAEMGDGAKLVIVGDGPLTSSLEPFYGESDGIIWLGAIADEQKRIDILRSADAFVLPSLVEGLSLSLLEAMACGTAILATDAGADGEVLEDGAGIILSTQDVSSQLKILLPIMRDHPEMTEILGQKARKRVLERYTLSQNISHLERLYEDVLKQRQPYLSKKSLFPI
jgi:glycosyltransferase involved in cell wall biosynthesis